jgi:hypothetical protein
VVAGTVLGALAGCTAVGSGGFRAVGGNAVAALRIDLPPDPSTLFDSGAGTFRRAASSSTSSSAPAPTPDELAALAVFDDLDRFWDDVLAAEPLDGVSSSTRLRGGFVAVEVAAGNDEDLPAALCVRDPQELRDNAFYCPGDDGIVWDTGLVSSLREQYGDGGLAVSLAHEFGHAVQARVGAGPDSADPDDVLPLLVEAQADCAAGAFLAWAARGGSRWLRLPPEALAAGVAPLLDFRDPVDVPPRDPQAHGLGVDRLVAATRGLDGDPAACFRLDEDTVLATTTLGRTRSSTTAPDPPPEDELVAEASDSALAFGGLDPGTEVRLDPEDLATARRTGGFAVAAAAAREVGQDDLGSPAGAACFLGAWTASEADDRTGLAAAPGSPDEALDYLRTRPAPTIAELTGFAHGFVDGLPACG